MSKEHLPEEKLLKLIRGKKIDKGAVPSKPVLKTGGAKKFELKYFFGFFNIFLIVTVLGLAMFLFYRGMLLSKENKDRLSKTLTVAQPVEGEEAGLIAEKPPLEYYKDQFAKRDLFERPLTQVAVSASADLTKRYKLVGIVLGEKPEAIVEDLSTRGTVFIHEGDMLDAVQVKKIEEGRVVFLQEGLEVELKQ